MSTVLQHGDFSASSKSTIIVTGASGAICTIFEHTLWIHSLGKCQEENTTKTVGTQKAGKRGEGVVGR